jgi:hypothetical protein
MKTKTTINEAPRKLVALVSIVAMIATAGMAAASPFTQPNNSIITVSGKVTEADSTSFILDYGEGSIPVTMSAFDWYVEGFNLLKNDHVTVHGRVDASKEKPRSIVADSLYANNLNTFFYSKSSGEKDFLSYIVITSQPVVFPYMELRGTVEKVDGREFTLNTGTQMVVVDTKSLDYNHMDDEGYQVIRPGDYVSVTGMYDKGVFEKDEIAAGRIITLKKS